MARIELNSVTVYLDDELYSTVQREQKKSGKSMSKYIEELIRVGVGAPPAQKMAHVSKAVSTEPRRARKPTPTKKAVPSKVVQEEQHTFIPKAPHSAYCTCGKVWTDKVHKR